MALETTSHQRWGYTQALRLDFIESTMMELAHSLMMNRWQGIAAREERRKLLDQKVADPRQGYTEAARNADDAAFIAKTLDIIMASTARAMFLETDDAALTRADHDALIMCGPFAESERVRLIGAVEDCLHELGAPRPAFH
ncbi:MAG: hypothetical protein WDN46_20880 [Methylocella sp.]